MQNEVMEVVSHGMACWLYLEVGMDNVEAFGRLKISVCITVSDGRKGGDWILGDISGAYRAFMPGKLTSTPLKMNRGAKGRSGSS